MDIRMVGPDDVPALIEMGKAFYETGKLPGEFDADTFVAFWEASIQEGRGVIIMGEREGVPVGTLGALLFADPCNGALVAQELFWWVNDDARGNGSLRLVQAFEAWAKGVGASRVVMTAIYGLREEAIGRIYESRGYHELETNYAKDI